MSGPDVNVVKKKKIFFGRGGGGGGGGQGWTYKWVWQLHS